MTLDELQIGEKSKIVAVNGKGALRRRLLDMGLTPRTGVLVRKVAPMGDPMEIHLRDYELTLRMEDAKMIEIEPETNTGIAPHKNKARNSTSAPNFMAGTRNNP